MHLLLIFVVAVSKDEVIIWGYALALKQVQRTAPMLKVDFVYHLA